MSYQNLRNYPHSDKIGNASPRPGEPVVVVSPGGMVLRRPMEDQDWDSLFEAVENKLADCATELKSLPQGTSDDEALKVGPVFRPKGIRDTVLDCVDSLDKLHVALRIKRASQANDQ